MDRNDEELLERFQCDYNRRLEETFAQTLAENENARLFFINENQAFTDGRNIIVDPAHDQLFADRAALDDTGDFLEWPRVVLIDPWNALRIITRAQTIHECLHLLYSDFLPRLVGDERCDTKNKTIIMGLISNIIEDAYIEAVGCSYFDNMEFYLKFGRVSRLFANHPSEGTVNRCFGKIVQAEKDRLAAEKLREEQETGGKQESSERTNGERLMDILDYMANFLLYPMVRITNMQADVATYMEAVKPLALAGSMAPSPKERYEYSTEIFEIIKELIPPDTEPMDPESLVMKLGGTKTHDGAGNSIGGEKREGKAQAVATRLFTDLEGKEKPNRPNVAELMQAIQAFSREKQAALQEISYQGSFAEYHGSDYDCAVIHKGIKINEIHPKINLSLRVAYQNIYRNYKSSIRSYSNRFSQKLKARIDTVDDKFMFGNGISSRRLGDLKKRYWYRKIPSDGIPDMAVLLLIDGSGSMFGPRQRAAMHSAVILHEVLKRQEMPHAVALHRAEFEESVIDVNILCDFDGREEEKLNLMQIDAYGDNRDGLALFWAERYMLRCTTNEYRLIIVLSDGVPAHEVDDYYPPVSTKDTANAVRKITKRGTDIIGISLDEPGEFTCYEQLSQIYPNLVACNDLNRLTGQLLGIIAKLL